MDTPAIIGFVEAITESHVLGWAWSPALPDEALLVELRLGEQVIAHGHADRLREDLRTNGVGDGRHAFELPIEEAYRERAAEITVQASRADGVMAPLAPAPPADIPPAASRRGWTACSVCLASWSARSACCIAVCNRCC